MVPRYTGFLGSWLPYLVLPRGGDLAVELGAGVQIVVVGGEPRVPQLGGLRVVQHAQRGAHLQVQRADLAHHLQHAAPLAGAHLRGPAPGRAHAEARAAGLLGAQGGLRGRRETGRRARLGYSQSMEGLVDFWGRNTS